MFRCSRKFFDGTTQKVVIRHLLSNPHFSEHFGKWYINNHLINLRHAGAYQISTMVNLGTWIVQAFLNLTRR